MHHTRAPGSVSIFSACIIMLLIVFCCSIVDITRIHIAQVQAERALYTSNRSILASYDSQLSSQYGIFAKDFSNASTIKNNVYYYTNSSLNPKDVEDTSSFMIQYLYPESDYYSFYNYDINIDSVNSTTSLVSDQGIAYTKLQILNFMKYRAPLQAVEPFLENFIVMGKATKTSEIIAQKNEVVANMVEVQENIKALELSVDGIIIDYYDTVTTDDVYDCYIKKLVAREAGTEPYYPTDYVPDQQLMGVLKENIFFLDDEIGYYKFCIDNCHSYFSEGVKEYISYNNKAEDKVENNLEISRINDKLKALEKESNEEVKWKLTTEYNKLITDLNEENAELDDEMEESMASIKAYIALFNKNDGWLYKLCLPSMEGLIGEYYEDPDAYYSEDEVGYLTANLLAKDCIAKIKEETESLQVEIDALKAELANEDDQYIEDTCTSLEEEIASYEAALGISDNSSDNIINNLSDMETVIDENIELLMAIQDEVESLSGTREMLYAYWVDEAFDSTNQDLIDDFLKLKDGDGNKWALTYDESITVNSAIETDINSWLDTIETGLDGYSRELYFDYPPFDEGVSETFKEFLASLQEKAEGLFPELHFFDSIELLVASENLPSTIMGQGFVDATTGVAIDASTEGDGNGAGGANDFLSSFSDMGQMFGQAITGVRDTLYINEYIIGMFNSATDNLEKPGEALTLNNYQKDKHVLNYEVEYILMGNQYDYANILAVAAIIFTIRIVFNIIHIVTSANKMNQITNFSNVVAGWWSFGIGTAIVTVVLTLLWAASESAIDIQKLIDGDKVAILKTEENWESDIFGGLEAIAEEVATDVMDEAVEGVVESDGDTTDAADASIIPELSYNDYLRFLLLLGIVDEETKIIRILDLIQINLEKERNQEVILENYVTSIGTEATFTIDYIFFKLPFMPDNIKNIGDNYSFTSECLVGY